MEVQLQILLDIVIAAILAGVIGFERESVNKPAGLRTHMIIGAAAALLVTLGNVLVLSYYAQSELHPMLRTDPIRILEALIVGVSFIGAGTILKHQKGNEVLYLTTAASILLSAGIGASVALHQYYLAGGVTILGLIINYVFRMWETGIRRRNGVNGGEDDRRS